IAQNRKPSIGPPEDLRADARPVIEAARGLPSVHQPGLDFPVLIGENLYAHAIAEPWRVRRHVRWLIGPVVEVVVAEQAHIRHEDPGLNIDTIHYVEVISGVGLGDIAIGIGKLPLATRRAGIVAWRGRGIHADAYRYV